ncbi:unnamed protein product [Heterotrigona itama]|uniref:Uncharacterized protein n=1 Tax=Heterotrigona itama TaxID=395501 RepID=A0A6V7GYW9_9HYME|nr:unnamed protein product [Heterotrigona itama]
MNKSKCVAHSYFDARDHPDSCCKHTQKRSQSFLVSKSSGKNPELSSSYYSSPTCYKPPKNTSAIHDSDNVPYLQRDVSRSKPNRDKHCSGYSSNFSSTRKTHYDDELRNIDSFKFTDDKLGDFAGGHDVVEDQVEHEVAEDDREVLAELLDKDYEEQEEGFEDDEIDDESDRSPQTRSSRSQRGCKPEALSKQQRWRCAEQQSDTRKFCRQQRVATLENHSPASRYYHSVTKPEEPEPLSEEDFVRTSLRWQPADYRQWSSSRNEPDRYDDVATSMQPARRARTKPDVDRLIEQSELNRTRRCDRCGSLSSSKNVPPFKNTCRFDDCSSIPIKGPIGDEPENYEQTFCGRCNVSHGSKDPSGIVATKSRRSRETKFYEVPDQSQEKFSSDYSRSPSRYQSRIPADRFTEKSKRSLHTSHGTARILPRYVE